MKKHALKLTLLVSMTAALAAGCGMPGGKGHEDSTKPRIQSHNTRPFQYGTGNNRDLRLGFDQYRGNDPDLIRNENANRQGMDRSGGFTDHAQNGANHYGRLNANSRVETSEQIAQQVAAIPPVETANVLLTDNNAYVAVKMKDGNNADAVESIKAQVAEKVKAVQPQVGNVYVSANPEFVDRMKGYAEHVRQGKPFQGFVDEFNLMTQRLFPANAANPGAVTDGQGMNRIPGSAVPNR